MLTLRSSEGDTFEVPRAVALQSETIRRICMDFEEDDVIIPLIDISSIVLPELIQYLETSIVDEWNAFRNFEAQVVNADLEKLKAFVRATTFLELHNLATAAAEAIKPMVTMKNLLPRLLKAFNF